MSALCEAVGADAHAVSKGMGLDGQVLQILAPWSRVRWLVFPQSDTLALVGIAQENDASCRIVEAVVEVDAAQRARMVKKIRTALQQRSGQKARRVGTDV